jgi:hypothetical protein
MNLDEMLKAPPRRTNACKWSQWWVSINESERQAITAAFTDLTTETSHICRVLREYGCPMSDSTIRTHRLNECKTCGR